MHPIIFSAQQPAEHSRSFWPFSVVSMAALTLCAPTLEAGPLGDGPLSRFRSTGGVRAGVGRSQSLRYEKTVLVDADFDKVLKYFTFIDGDKELQRAERLSFMKTAMEDRCTRLLGVDPTSVDTSYSVVSRTSNGRVLRAALPGLIAEVFVPAQRGGVTYRVPVRQEKLVELQSPLTVRSVTLNAHVDAIMEPHWRFGIGPQSASVKIARGVMPDGKPCTSLTFSSTLRIETHGVLGHRMILERASDTFAERCDGVLSRNAALLREKSRDSKLHAGPLEMLGNARKLFDLK